jgi:hypothetical protein
MSNNLNNSIKTGVIIGEKVHIDEGVNSSFRCPVYYNDNEIMVIAKKIEDKEFVAEIFCSIIGLNIGLPLPEPIIVLEKSETGIDRYFGSVDTSYPSLKHYVSDHDWKYESFHEKIKKWIFLDDAAFFDELIVNGDRHKGNILYDGNDYYLIDHGLAFNITRGFKPHQQLNNRNILLNHSLCRIKNECNCKKISSQKLSNKLHEWVMNIITNEIIQNSYKSISLFDIDKKYQSDVLTFLLERSKLIENILNSNINPHQMDFINNAKL